MKKRHIQGILLCSVIGLSACSSQPSIGEQMLNQGGGTEELGEKWIDGEKLTKKGHKKVHDGKAKIKKGEKLIKAGRAEIRKGHAMIDKGKQKTHVIEETFRQKFPEVELGNS